jgi:hypothetical protein
MKKTARGRLIDQYKAGPRVFTDAVDGITEQELDAQPGPGEWTARQVVHHMADSEMTSAIRLRRLLAEDEPTIAGYDEEEFARRLYYAERPIKASLEAMQAARESTAEILDLLTDEQWARRGHHSESGTYGVETWLDIYAVHAHDHADQIRRCREAARPDH